MAPTLTTAPTWHGRRGVVILGPTEDRVARYLNDATRRGRVTLRTVELASRLRLDRSEVYRITARLRMLGLFGIENDRGGTRGGRRYWRTAIEHDGARLDARRHRVAWSRVLAWSRARRARLVGAIRALHTPAAVPPRAAPATPTGARDSAPVGGTFADLVLPYLSPDLTRSWRLR